MLKPFGRTALFLAVILLSLSCGNKKQPENRESAPTVAVPKFNADSALAFVRTQVSFGPRIPNTLAHQEAGDYIIRKLKAYGARVQVQEFEAQSYDGKNLKLRNIVGSFRPEVQKRILLAAHWDTRPFADKDTSAPDKPFDGANDGASGVAVLLEIARNLKTQPQVGVDLIFFDGEDWGEPDGSSIPKPPGLDSWWCLGSQHWSKNKHMPGYRAYFGILLDMVGGTNAQFFQEGTSVFYAPKVVEKVWSTAARLGYSSTFVTQKESPITDDHLFVNELGGIPMINITPFEAGKGYFGSYHHTQQDNMDLISAKTLGIVGNVVMQVVYEEE
ncbi:MAG: M28 family peptidase [Cyclobacteriaceae bacterium]|nr:M28 family peptidase [Cyclobacteriaceae bacterium]